MLLIDTLEREVIERICNQLEETAPKKLLFSYGVSFSNQYTTLEEVINAADANMYENKPHKKEIIKIATASQDLKENVA